MKEQNLEYWKKRCELAEAYINESPCDPDIYPDQWKAWEKWQDFIKEKDEDESEEKRLIIAAGEVFSLWKEKDGIVHTMKSFPSGVVGCDYSIEEAKKIVMDAESCEISGDGAMGLGHGICVAPKGATMWSECIFFEHDKEKFDAFLKEHEGKKD